MNIISCIISAHGKESGLVLEDEFGEPHLIPIEALAELLAKQKILECIVLNACYSISQGVKNSPGNFYTIAMENRISNLAGIEFSRGFYDAVFAGQDYQSAFQEGLLNVKLTLPEAEFLPVLIKGRTIYRETNHKSRTKSVVGDDADFVFTNIWCSLKYYGFQIKGL